MSSSGLLIGIGNEYRSDDAVGLVVIRVLRARGLPGTVCIESNGDGAALLETWATAEQVLLVDAVSSGAKPGTIHRLDGRAQPLPASLSFPSTHAFGVAEALQLARALDLLPASLTIYGIEGKQFSAGIGLSPEVEHAAQEVVEQMLKEVRGSV